MQTVKQILRAIVIAHVHALVAVDAIALVIATATVAVLVGVVNMKNMPLEYVAIFDDSNSILEI